MLEPQKGPVKSHKNIIYLLSYTGGIFSLHAG